MPIPILPQTGARYTDIKGDEWYSPYVSRASLYGLVEGYSDGTFKPDNTISRAETTTIVVKAFERNAAISLITSGAVLIAIYYMFKKT